MPAPAAGTMPTGPVPAGATIAADSAPVSGTTTARPASVSVPMLAAANRTVSLSAPQSRTSQAVRGRGPRCSVGSRSTTVVQSSARTTASNDSVIAAGPPAASPWDPELANLMTTHRCAVMEERLIPTLLTDLAP